ncbi:conserved exported protein of unknown function [Pseudomonas marincola]|uniref:Lipoprotein n=2 Tax=Pseudomonas marincola TaxID=437900 RepID=A0A653EAG8_9PSED|nr:hypothetical protein [Pseudomonas marincola]CAE6929065.1 conserved exported protein of unknown function [Pseudomonas marincola]
MKALASMLCTFALLGASAGVVAQTYPMPSVSGGSGGAGTANPKPYTPVTPRGMPSTAPNNPPLISPSLTDKPAAQTPLRRPVDSLAPPDKDLQLLEQQRQRNSEKAKDPAP